MTNTQHRAAFEAALAPHLCDQTNLASPWSKIEALIDELVASDALAKASIQHAQNEKYTLPKGGVIQLGFVLYWVAYSKELEKFVKHLPKILQAAWGVIARILIEQHSPTVTPADYAFVQDNLHGEGIIAPNGEILGVGKYEGADTDWLWAFFNYLLNLVDKSEIAPFTPPSTDSGSSAPFDEPLQGSGPVKIAVIGDWGTGQFDGGGGYDPAEDVLSTVMKLSPDYIIHLGDVYYCGTELRYPPGEESANLVKMWPPMPPKRSFTLNSNHEMYGGARGYFDVALGRGRKVLTPFSHQNGYSYFALTRGDWAFVGIDAAYFDPSTLYMTGGLGQEQEDPQYGFLSDIASKYENIVLFSHQTAMSTDGTESLQLWSDITSVIPASKIKLWYWGHIHLGIVYGATSALGEKGVQARCAGHSAIPIGAPWGIEAGSGKPVEWVADESLTKHAFPNRVANGFALLTVSESGVSEAFYNAGSTVPAWPDGSPTYLSSV